LPNILKRGVFLRKLTAIKIIGTKGKAMGLSMLGAASLVHLQSCVSTKANYEQTSASGQAQTQASPQTPPLPAAQALQIPIGTVHMVDEGGKFILIKSSRSTELEPGSQIIAYGTDARMSSHLKACPARKGAYLAADMIEGVPSIGDMVMMVKTLTEPAGKDQPVVAGAAPQVLE